MTSKDELREKPDKVEQLYIESANMPLPEFRKRILNLLEGEAESYYKKGYQDAEEDCTAIWTAKLATLNKEPNKGEDV